MIVLVAVRINNQRPPIRPIKKNAPEPTPIQPEQEPFIKKVPERPKETPNIQPSQASTTLLSKSSHSTELPPNPLANSANEPEYLSPITVHQLPQNKIENGFGEEIRECYFY